ncbi:hypothetical protein BYI23_B010920 [Burkholderia sp. YI23]|nr:hypothetical protein BYI23_B010920 [Burkholderia sp. YI23]
MRTSRTRRSPPPATKPGASSARWKSTPRPPGRSRSRRCRTPPASRMKRCAAFSTPGTAGISPTTCTTRCTAVLDLAAAIDAATHKWMGWTIGRATSRQHGIPRGLPYLTGFIIHCDILAHDE